MLRFTSSLNPDSEAFAIFVTEKYDYKDKLDIFAGDVLKKIKSNLITLKIQKRGNEIDSFDISDHKKCFVIKIKNKYESYYPEETGGAFYSYLKKFKHIKKIDLYADSLDYENEKIVKFF